ncbi:MAG: hypothetical protein E7267_03055 [Lachnospiraceae bacterium]|nr:hypothetical protein [Lachnospiraceae bacterium]
MKTKLELLKVIYEHLETIGFGYENGTFDSLFTNLSKNCVLTSQIDNTTYNGYEEVVSCFAKISELIKESGSNYYYDFGHDANYYIGDYDYWCMMHETFIDSEENADEKTLGYPCLVIEPQKHKDEKRIIICLDINEEEKISRIDFYLTDYLNHWDFDCIGEIIPCIGDKEIDEGEIFISENYYHEFQLFLGKINKDFYTHDYERVPIKKWIEFLENWRRFYSFNTYEDAYENACGINHEDNTVGDELAKTRLDWYGKDYIWDKREYHSAMLEALTEWTDKYKEMCDYIDLYGFPEDY